VTTVESPLRSAAPSPYDRGVTVWFTGLPSAGKSTVANGLAERLRADGHRVEVLDGDAVRPHLSAGLGYSRADRDANVARIGWVASLLARQGVKVLAAVVSPYADARDLVRSLHADDATPFVEVHVSTPLEVCAERDVKGLYARAAAGELTGMTGVDDPYEPPAAPEVVVPTHALALDDAIEVVHTALRAKGLA
jgi:adenylylsulfate kinase